MYSGLPFTNSIARAEKSTPTPCRVVWAVSSGNSALPTCNRKQSVRAASESQVAVGVACVITPQPHSTITEVCLLAEFLATVAHVFDTSAPKRPELCLKMSGKRGVLRISYYLAACLPPFHPKQVHFEGFWLKRAAICGEIGSCISPVSAISGNSRLFIIKSTFFDRKSTFFNRK